MRKSRFLRLFALVELFTAAIFIVLAIIFYLNRGLLGDDIMIPLIFASIGACALIAAPVLFSAAKKHDSNNSQITNK